MKVMITGHRVLGGTYAPNPTSDWAKQEIENIFLKLKNENDDLTLITGMAIGVDQWAAEIAIKLDIPFIAAIPFEGQDSLWPSPSKKHYEYLKSCADEVVVVCPGEGSAVKMQIRNIWMVDRADAHVVVYDGSAGGTRNCFKYIISKELPHWMVNIEKRTAEYGRYNGPLR